MGMTSDPQDAYVQMLTDNLQRALDFLKFAEAKNAALLALASAWMGATLNLECDGKVLPRGFTISIPIALIFALCAGVLAMTSFLPRLHLPSFLGGKRAGPHPANFLYFGDISTLPVKALEQGMAARYLSTGQGYKDEYIHDLTVQLSVNSEITMRKMRLFNWGMRLILAGGVVLLLPSLRLACVAVRSLW
jgi:hypothetical protein